jgi:hypothetical protein
MQQGSACDFHSDQNVLSLPLKRAVLRRSAKIAPRRTSQNPVTQSAAPNMLHPPVNQLHSIENAKDTIAHFSLTLKTKRVKP